LTRQATIMAHDDNPISLCYQTPGIDLCKETC
jgi:hypothetical protein